MEDMEGMVDIIDDRRGVNIPTGRRQEEPVLCGGSL